MAQARLAADPEEPGGQERPAELTIRAVVLGSAIGILLAVGNIYMALKTGWWDTGAITASILGFALAGVLARRRDRPYSELENNVTQTVATSIGAMPAVAGLLGAVPAYGMMGLHYSGYGLAGFGLGLGAVGTIIGFALRKRLLLDEDLPFPTGIATAELIQAMHATAGTARRRARALLATGGGVMAFTWLRDAQGWIAGMTALPFRIGGIDAGALTLGLAWSPMMIGAGALVGLRAAASVLLGAALAWAVGAPLLIQHHIVAGADYGSLVAWLAWPGVALMIGASVVSLLQQARSFTGAARDLWAFGRKAGSGGLDRRAKQRAALALVPVLAVVVLGKMVFDLEPLHTAALLALSAVLGAVAARAAGQTDISPVGPMGQLAQAIFGPFAGGRAALDVAAGSVPSGCAAQTTSTLWSLRAGQRLGASVEKQAIAQLLGVLVGAAVSVPVYALLVGAYGLGSEALPAVSGVGWKAVAEVVARGSAALPPFAGTVSAAAFALGALLSLVEASPLARTRAGKLLPSAAAMGIGFITPAGYSAAIFVGALALAAAQAKRPRETEHYAPAVCAGAIAGESLMGVVIAILIAAKLVALPG